ncbi:MAG: potassium channel protein [Chloroflexi bacterium]|nr:potassium channel protein [Chloroflexota bacterium]
MNSGRRVLWGIYALAAIIVTGVIGYVTVEGWSFIDALFMTIITVTTVGYGEVHPLTAAGRIFSIFLIIGGVGASLYTLTGVIEYLIEGEIGATFGRRRMQNRIAKLKGHFILCGLGRVGEEIARTLHEENVPFVIIDSRPDCIARAAQTGYLYVQGDASSDEILKEAGIEQARRLIAAVGNDAENTYITLSARGLRPDLFIEARANSQEAEKKLERAGANRVVSPDNIGARRMALLALRPAVVDFVDDITRRGGPDLLMENVSISSESALAGQSVDELRQCSKATILAINKKNGQLVANPSGEEKVLAGDSLIIVGTGEQLNSLEGICQGVKPNE